MKGFSTKAPAAFKASTENKSKESLLMPTIDLIKSNR